tara:strand:- start:454 stop:705 length:252 start_codon:yes stop_codon:yes gene_type:complete
VTDSEQERAVTIPIELTLPEDFADRLKEESEVYRVPLSTMLSAFLVMVDITRKEGANADLNRSINWMAISDAAPWLIPDGEEP